MKFGDKLVVAFGQLRSLALMGLSLSWVMNSSTWTLNIFGVIAFFHSAIVVDFCSFMLSLCNQRDRCDYFSFD